MNECGSNSYTQNITVSTLPVAGFSANIIEDCVPLTVEFMNNSSDNATAYDWSFPGGIPESSTEENPIISYEEMGIYDVSLIVSSLAGYDTMMLESYITTLDQPNANFEHEALSQFEYSFSNLSSDADSYMWDFGDGTNSVEENPIHEYEQPGMYIVRLIAVNDCGETIHEEEITVAETTSIEEETAFSEMKVAPNPNNGLFNVFLNSFAYGEVELKIYNMLGQPVYKEKFAVTIGENRRAINLEQTVSGVYFLEIKKDNLSRVTKVFLN